MGTTPPTACPGINSTLTATGNGTIQWFDGANQIGSGTSITVNPTVTTTYTATLTDANGCTDSKNITVTVDPCLSIEENINNNITIYPNPSNSFVEIKIGQNHIINSLQILSIDGKEILSHYEKLDDLTYRFDLNTIPDGVYFINVSSNLGQYSEKIVVLK